MQPRNLESRSAGSEPVEPVAGFEAYLQQHNLRMTRERREILRIILDWGGHFDAEELFAHMRRRGSRVSRATLYRTLDHLRAAGLVRMHRFGSGHAVYEHTHGREHHDHMMCDRCGRVVEFMNAEIERLQLEVCRQFGFLATHHVMQIFGICAECRNAPEGDAGGNESPAGA